MSSPTRRRAHVPRWSSIPTELAGVVLRRLPSHANRVRFAAVCKQWRASALQSSPPSHYPWLALPDRTFYSLPGSAFRPLPLHLDRHRQLPHAHSSCGEWLVFERYDGAYTLVSPFSMSTTILLPGLSDTYAPNVPLLVANDQPKPNMLKLVVCSRDLVAAIINDEGWMYNKLALCRPGASSWRSSTPDQLCDLQDIVSCQGKLYALDKFNGLFSVSISVFGNMRTGSGEPIVSQVEHLLYRPRGVLRHSSRYLLESSGTLLLVCREDAMPEQCSSTSMSAVMDGLELEMEMEFELLKADLERSRWTNVSSVGDDRVLFVGPWCSRVLHVTGEHDPIYTAGNRIFFTVSAKRYNRCQYYGKQEPFYCIVYDMRTQRSELFLKTPVRPLLMDFPVTWLFPPSHG
ncbi:uncharacterized protein LOC123446704 [Hordeum vulgare subsp. vulgare]|uniref:KIB1-4 beta-propeller domain-containing protein n=1 Tax=Hordeum vulgare subsp. vulgare TaxID=112509 RepID=A0A8I6XM09_HORVV|nr:uncharacterized protein LOC123446704 [Hordeum vulgare subsp. vulgare]